MKTTFQVIDLFAGPGGLAEGFASIRSGNGTRAFRIALSIEKDPVAYRTLRFRSFLRQFPEFPNRYYQFLNGEIDEPDWASEFPHQWQAAEAETMLLELGADGTAEKLNPGLAAIRERSDNRSIVIGGPPCQAYSIVGRARNKGKAGYTPAQDNRHFLYREYIAILERVRPTAFVMENVKGILSSSVDGQAIFGQVLADLRAIGDEDSGYELLAFSKDDQGVVRLTSATNPRDFVIYAEEFGIPQARHRVIIIGVRRSALPATTSPSPLDTIVASGRTKPQKAVKATVRDVLEGMPKLRSGLSRGDSASAWLAAIAEVIETVQAATSGPNEAMAKVSQHVAELKEGLSARQSPLSRDDTALGILSNECPALLRQWLVDPRLKRLSDHSSRGHMPADLARYMFVSAFAAVNGRSPLAREFPATLAPNHKNWESGHFADRFRAQLWTAPSTTITSHIGKDGHYFIHPDPAQCRALTVREAARLQTFPDNYRFLGNQSQQFTQVGNAVPPLLANQIARALYNLLTGQESVPNEVSNFDYGGIAQEPEMIHDSAKGIEDRGTQPVRKRTRRRCRFDSGIGFKTESSRRAPLLMKSD